MRANLAKAHKESYPCLPPRRRCSPLRRTVDKFSRRSRAVEAGLADRADAPTLDEMDALWEAAKAAERDG